MQATGIWTIPQLDRLITLAKQLGFREDVEFFTDERDRLMRKEARS